jgi:aminoglycoside phosphotransferase family enzyme
LRLNQRLAAEIYLKVVPIYQNARAITFEKSGHIIDNAVMMRRMDNQREMTKLLPGKKVSHEVIVNLAHQVATFHHNAQIILGKVTPESLQDDFKDIGQIIDFVRTILGEKEARLLKRIIEDADRFVLDHHSLIDKRSSAGFVRDCHGDLHSGNIFILGHPVIFDCIEFNEHFRHIDILNEVAFLCMDLEFHRRKDLSELFLQVYSHKINMSLGHEEKGLFLFYKLYRANVKTKVNAIKAMQASAPHDTKDRNALFKKYFKLMTTYSEELKTFDDRMLNQIK